MKMTEHTMKSWDGTPLFYRAWNPARPTDKALLLFHRGHEHSGRWQEVVDLLKLDDFSIFAWDARGHGQSPGDRGSAENEELPIPLSTSKPTDSPKLRLSAKPPSCA